MAKAKPKYDWVALRDEWVDCRLRGEALTRQAFAAEHAIPYGTLRRHAGLWQDELDQREAEIAEVVRDRTTIDHATMRIAILEEREPLRELLMHQAEGWLEWAKEETKKPFAERTRMAVKDMVALENLLVKMAEVGAGLPKEHVVRHDDDHDAVEVGRREMESLESTVVEMAKWKRSKRLAKEKA